MGEFGSAARLLSSPVSPCKPRFCKSQIAGKPWINLSEVLGTAGNISDRCWLGECWLWLDRCKSCARQSQCPPIAWLSQLLALSYEQTSQFLCSQVLQWHGVRGSSRTKMTTVLPSRVIGFIEGFYVCGLGFGCFGRSGFMDFVPGWGLQVCWKGLSSKNPKASATL